jgi:DNA-binding IclR family transcriptional regulator
MSVISAGGFGTMTRNRLERTYAVYEAVRAAGEGGIGRSAIAKAVGIGNTKYLHELLDTLVAAGAIQAWWDDTYYPPAWKYRWLAEWVV